MKKLTPNSLRFIPVALCLLFSLLANNAKAANVYFDVNGTTAGYGVVTGSTYSWDDPNWAAATGGGTATANWVAGNFARFNGPASYTVTVNNNESMAGLYVSVTGYTLTLNAAGSGAFSVVPNATTGPDPLAQGFYCDGAVIVNVPIGGTGGIQPQYVGVGAALSLNAINTYSGGTLFTSSSTFVNFNNNSAFGPGTIYIDMASGSFVPVLGHGGATLTLANNFTNCISGGGINFAADASTPVISSGNWGLAANNLNLRNNGNSTAPLTLTGVISGTASLTMSANYGGEITLGGASTYSGRTIISAGANVAGVGMTLSVGSINSVSGGSASSNLGAPTSGNGTIGIGLTTFTSTLIYTGVGETSDRAIDLAGTSGGATLQNDGTGALTFSSAFTVTGAGSKTLTLQGSYTTTANTISGAIVDNSSANKTAVAKAGACTWVLGGVNTYTGGTTVNAGTLEVAGSIAGNVTNTSASGVLQLDSPTALSSSALVALAGTPAAGAVTLNFTGTQPINLLYFGTTPQLAGTYGSSTSGADHTSNIFTGNGKLSVNGAPYIVTQPQSQWVWPDASVTFSVVALGSPTYQWKHGSTPVGANSSSYTINPAEAGDAGTYTCYLVNGSGNATTADAVLTVVSTNAYTQLVRGDSPISYWRLDEASGTVAHDMVGNNNGTYHNVLLNQTPGYSTIDSDACVGMTNSSSGSYVSVANYNAFNFFTSLSPTFTLEGWAYFTNVTGVQRLFSTDQNVQPLGYMFGISGANQLVFTTSGYNDYFSPTLASPLQANVWYHLVVGCDGSSLYFYVNGQPVGSTLLLATPRGGTNGVPMCLGANGNFPGIYEQVKGSLDECAIYGTFLGDYEVLQHYNATLPSAPVALTPVADQPTNYVSLTTTFTENAVGTDLQYQWTKVGSGTVLSTSSTLTLSSLALGDAGSYQVVVSNGGGTTNPPAATLTVLAIPTTAAQVGLTNGMVLHLPFDTDYKDISGRNNNGTAVNATTLPIDSPIVGGGYLHYSSDVTGPSYNYVTLGKPSDLQFGSSVDFSVAFWVRQAFANVGTNLPFFGSAAGSIGANLGFCFAPGLTSLLTPNGGWAWEIYDGTHQDYATGVPSSISDGNWHHLAFVFNRTANVTTYLDGQQADSRSDSYLGASIDSGNTINIGQDPTGSYPAAATQGDLDDLGVWRRALTQLEVSGMYLAGVNNNVSFAPVVTSTPPTPTTIGSLSAGATTLSYSGGSGSQFVLLGTNNVTAPLTNWTRLATNSSTPGSFPIPAVGSASPRFYRIQSE